MPLRRRRGHDAAPGVLRSARSPRWKNGSSSRLASSGFVSKASLILPRNARADDAAAAPHQRDAAVVQVPAVLLGRRAHQHVALRVGDDLRGVERVRGCRRRSALLVARELRLRALQHLARRRRARPSAPTGSGRRPPRRSASAGMPRSSAAMHRPLAGALLAGGVEDHVDQRLAVSSSLKPRMSRGDLDQVAVELALVPLGEDLRASRSASGRGRRFIRW